MGACCGCGSADFFDEDLYKTNSIEDIVDVMEEKLLDFNEEKSELQSYLDYKTDYLRMEYLRLDRFTLEKKKIFLDQLSTTTKYFLKRIKKYKKKVPYDKTYKFANELLRISHSFIDDKFELTEFYKEFKSFINKYKTKNDRLLFKYV